MKVKTATSITTSITPEKWYEVIDPEVHYSSGPFCGWIIDDFGLKQFIMLSGKSNFIGDIWQQSA
jgi:hypothetical protein